MIHLQCNIQCKYTESRTISQRDQIVQTIRPNVYSLNGKVGEWAINAIFIMIQTQENLVHTRFQC